MIQKKIIAILVNTYGVRSSTSIGTPKIQLFSKKPNFIHFNPVLWHKNKFWIVKTMFGLNFYLKAGFDFFDLRSVRLAQLQNALGDSKFIQTCRIIYQKKGILIIYNTVEFSWKNIASEKSYSYFSEHIWCQVVNQHRHPKNCIIFKKNSLLVIFLTLITLLNKNNHQNMNKYDFLGFFSEIWILRLTQTPSLKWPKLIKKLPVLQVRHDF